MDGPGKRSPSTGGYPFVVDPYLSAAEIHVFWLQAATPFVIPVAHAPPDAMAGLMLEELPIEVMQETHVALGPPGHDFQLVLLTPETAQPLAAVLTLDAELPSRLEAARRLWQRTRKMGAVDPPGTLTRQHRIRLVAALRALDARTSGASIRSIAAGLFGAERIPSGPEWKAHDLRSRTKRLVDTGLALMKGRYSELLHPSRSQRGG